MTFKKTLMAIGVIGLIVSAPSAIAAAALSMSIVYCAGVVWCENKSPRSCRMEGGNMTNLMYLETADFGNFPEPTLSIPYSNAGIDLSSGDVGCTYRIKPVNKTNIYAAFFSKFDAPRVEPVFTNDSKWKNASNNWVDCDSDIAERCPMHILPTLTM
jgi:hypothetical protein